MNDINYQSMVQEAAKAKFQGKKTVKARVIPRYPMSAEREYIRVGRAYTGLFAKILKDNLPELVEIYKEGIDGSVRIDAAGANDGGFRKKLTDKFISMSNDLQKSKDKFSLDKQIDRVSKIAQDTNIREWKRTVKDTTGIEVMEAYYRGENYETIRKEWVARNTAGMDGLINDAFNELIDDLEEGYRNRRPIGKLREKISKIFKKLKNAIKGTAVDEVGELDHEWTETEQTEAGVDEYIWWAVMDSRTRDSHRFFHGKKFKWDTPPEAWYMTKSRGKVYTGKYFHPGEDYGCRCRAIPIFKKETLNLPMKG